MSGSTKSHPPKKKPKGVHLWERRVFVSWLRFSRKHRHSTRLPVFFFFLLFLDGYLMVIPSTLCLIACVTISPSRWFLFAVLFPCAATLNNFTTYLLGTLVPQEKLLQLVDFFHIRGFWEEAGRAIHQYGDWAAFVGALLGLPTQMITALIGIADVQVNASAEVKQLSIFSALVLVFAGHLIKSSIIAGLSRKGWLKLEHKIAESQRKSDIKILKGGKAG